MQATTTMLLHRSNIYATILFSLFLIIVGHYFSIVDINEWFKQLPAWFFILFGVGLTIVVQKKLLFQKRTLSESDAAAQALEIRRNYPSRISKSKKYTGEKNVPFTADEFRRWMKLVTELTIVYHDHPEIYDVTTSEKPGFLYKKLPTEPSFEPETFDNVMKDLYSAKNESNDKISATNAEGATVQMRQISNSRGVKQSVKQTIFNQHTTNFIVCSLDSLKPFNV
uniref:Uncharacterized protein n=1 Tax=Panagrolaimus davidi TaxID=227884 RepID=A0A914PKD2_9BILA